MDLGVWGLCWLAGMSPLPYLRVVSLSDCSRGDKSD